MEELASKLARFVVHNSSESLEAFEIYKYGFQTGLEMITCMIVSLLISVYLQMLPEFLVFICIFVLLRTYMGGLHLEKFLSCFLCSTVVQTGVLLWASYVQFPLYYAWPMILICMGIILFIAPVENENRRLEDIEKKYVYKKVIAILISVLILCIFLTIIKWNSYVSLIADTLLVLVVSAIIGKVKVSIQSARSK